MLKTNYMRPYATLILLAICSLQLTIASPNIIFDLGDPNTRDLEVLANWFEGEFDNDDQMWVEARGDWWGKENEKHQQMHAIHKRVKADSIGNFVFYVEEYLDNDQTKISRQRLVSFHSLKEKPGIAMKIYFLKDASKYALDSDTHQTMMNTISKKNLFGLDGCDVIFQRKGEQYHGSMESKACQFGKGKEKRYSVHDIILSEKQYWRVDRTFLVKDDSFHKGHPNAEPHKMKKVKYYTCDVSFFKTAYYVPSEKDKSFKNLKVHNQGGKASMVNPINGKTYYIQLRDKEYPFYKLEDSNFFFLRLKEEGQKASVALAFAEPKAKKIGFQLGWVSAVCECEE